MKYILLLVLLLYFTPSFGQQEDFREKLFSIPCIPPLPIREAPKVNSGFGYRVHPQTGKVKFHAGVDMVANGKDELIFATANGEIKEAGYNIELGFFVCINHQNGYESVYGHLATYYVNKGETIRIGEVLGLMGTTGNATGYHLHYAIKKNGKAVNPLPYLYLALQN